ncbi:MAG: folate family ECF transporter S component [Candidatus Izemoplasma sp.]
MYKSRFTTQMLTRTALLVGTSIVLKAFLSLDSPTYRITFFELPLIILGILFGPVIGLIGGFIVDWIYVLYSPFAFSFNLMTLSTMLWGFIPGLYFLKIKRVSYFNLSIVIILTSLMAFSLNSVQLYLWFNTGMYVELPARIITMVIKLPMQIYLIKELHRLFVTYIDRSYVTD